MRCSSVMIVGPSERRRDVGAGRFDGGRLSWDGRRAAATSNTLPWPGVLWAVICPPWRSTILRHRASPMPVPSNTSRVQPLEDAENPLLVLLVEADAVVFDDDPALFARRPAARPRAGGGRGRTCRGP